MRSENHLLRVQQKMQRRHNIRAETGACVWVRYDGVGLNELKAKEETRIWVVP